MARRPVRKPAAHEPPQQLALLTLDVGAAVCGGLLVALFVLKSRRTAPTLSRAPPSAPPPSEPKRAPCACPFLHGTPTVDPYPGGYVHGKHPAICPAGCIPRLDATQGETARETLLREAEEFQRLYCAECAIDDATRARRWGEIVAEIAATGSYTLSFEELEHGVRVAWRNAPKCPNRAMWRTIKLLDRRGASSNKEMFDACLEHLSLASKCRVTECYCTCFRPQTPGTTDGPRVWNDQLLGYAGHRLPPTADEPNAVLGDPAKVTFTQMLTRRFGWPRGESQAGAFDTLPLVLQASPEAEPEIFEIPPALTCQVDIWHPDYPWLSELGLRWYGIPAVCALELSVGGLTFTANPFNGWYADVEVCRDLCDATRYNVLPQVAQRIGALRLDAHGEREHGSSPLWKDKALLVVNEAVLHSFGHKLTAIVDHDSLINGFYTWYRAEVRERGYCPGNWKWIIPPQASATTPAYMGLNRMIEYTLKPAYVPSPGWRSYEKSWAARSPELRAAGLGRPTAISLEGIVYAKRVRNTAWMRHATDKTIKVLIAFGTESGTSRRFAQRLSRLLSGCGIAATTRDLGRLKSDELLLAFDAAVADADLLLLLASTYGNGDPTRSTLPFLAALAAGRLPSLTSGGTPVGVVGFGDRRFPAFCGAVDTLLGALQRHAPVTALLEPIGRCDGQVGGTQQFDEWLQDFAEGAAEHGWGAVTATRRVGLQEAFGRVAQEGGVERLATDELLRTLRAGVCVEVVDVKRAMELMERSLSGRRGSVGSPGERSVGRRSSSSSSAELSERSGSSESGAGDWLDATASACTPLVDEAGAGRVALVSIDLTLAGSPPCTPGDHLALLPRNLLPDDALASFAAALGMDPDALCTVSLAEWMTDDQREQLEAQSSQLLSRLVGMPAPTMLRTILTEHAAILDAVPMEGCEALALLCSSRAERAELQRLGGDEDAYYRRVQADGLRFVDAFRLFPSLKGRLDAPTALGLIPMLQPRHYSVASHHNAAGRSRVDIVVAELTKGVGADGTPRKGVSSSFLNALSVGTPLRLRVDPVPSFYLPLDSRSPLLLISAGSGIAPFRAFWQQRLSLLELGVRLGACVLLRGERSPAAEILSDEVEAAVSAGALSSAHTAYSRHPDGRPRQHVQDLVSAGAVAEEVRSLLGQRNCAVYICGASAMAAAVEAALEGSVGAAAFEALQAHGRVQLEVYGTSSASAPSRDSNRDSHRDSRRDSGASLGAIPEHSDSFSSRLTSFGRGHRPSLGRGPSFGPSTPSHTDAWSGRWSGRSEWSGRSDEEGGVAGAPHSAAAAAEAAAAVVVTLPTARQAELLARTWATVSERGHKQVGRLFFALLFTTRTGALDLFGSLRGLDDVQRSAELEAHAEALVETVTAAFALLDDVDSLRALVLESLRSARRSGHAGRLLLPMHYPALGSTLVQTVSAVLGSGFTKEVEEAYLVLWELVEATLRGEDAGAACRYVYRAPEADGTKGEGSPRRGERSPRAAISARVAGLATMATRLRVPLWKGSSGGSR